MSTSRRISVYAMPRVPWNPGESQGLPLMLGGRSTRVKPAGRPDVTALQPANAKPETSWGRRIHAV